MTLYPEGLSGKVAFMSDGSIQATIFGQQETVTLVYIIGTPDSSGYTWQAGIVAGGCIVTTGPSDEIMAKLDHHS